MKVVSSGKTFLEHFPVPKFLLIATSGIAIADDFVRFVEFKRTRSGRGLDLVHCGTIKVPEGAVQSGFVHNPKVLGDALKELTLKYGVHYTSAALPDEKTYLFTTLIDRVPNDGLRDAVAFIVEENAPVSLAESIFDYEVVGVSKDKSKIKVAVSVLSRKKVEMYSEALEAGGITPISFDVESQAIARSVVPRGDRRAHLLINLDMSKTGLYVVEDEVVQFSSTSSFNTSGSVSDLRAEIRKVFAFWDSRGGVTGIPSKKIEKVLVCGPESTKADFTRELLEGIDADWSLANVWINALSMKDDVPDLSFDESLGFAVAIGLALPRRETSYV